MPWRPLRNALPALALGCGILCGILRATALAQAPSWELKVCADRDNLPYSNELGEGFENQIVAAVANAIGANLSYVWLPLQRRTSEDINLLRDGTCDVFLDIGNGGPPFLPTLDYYQSTYVFLYRADAKTKPTSLDDPALAGLRLGSAAASPPDTALAERGLIENVSNYFPVPPAGVTEAIVADVAAGKLDVGVVWGPEASYYAARQTAALEMLPITPEIDVDGLSMIYTAAMGVRSSDTELRDLLNLGMARSWDDVQDILLATGMPSMPLPSPVLSLAPSDVIRARVGVVLPMLTGDQPLGALSDDMVGSVAALGATMAGEDMQAAFEPAGRQLDVLISSAPDTASATRAARRLVGAEGVSALVGGFGGATAAALSDLAAASGVVFMNIGAQEDALRGADCSRNTFHVAASSSMYIDALVSYFAAGGARHWYFVTADDPEQALRLERATADLAGIEGATVETAVVAPDQANFTPVLNAIGRAAPDVVVMLQGARSQLVMLGQYETSGLSVPLVGYPEAATQLRQYYADAVYEDPTVGLEPHLALWDASLGADAGEPNERFAARFGQGMDPAAWAAYVAVKILAQAALATGSGAAADWVGYLEAPTTTLDVYKGAGTTFRSWDHQLRQPLYVVGMNPDYTDAKAYRDIGFVIAEVPPLAADADRATALDGLGASQAATTCRLGGAGG